MAERILDNVDTLIWDLDGTLIDSLGVLESGLAEVLPGHGRDVPDSDTIRVNFHGSLEDSIRAMLGSDVTDEQIAIIVSDFLKVQDSYYEAVDKHFYTDAIDLAQRAHEAGMRQVLVTNRFHEGRLKASPRSIVANSLLHKYVDVVICGDDSEHRKPKPEVLGALLEDIDIQSTVVIGDQFVDGQFAMNLGVRGILVARHGQIEHTEQLGDGWQNKLTVVSSLEEIQ